jgi:hypothetical protein
VELGSQFSLEYGFLRSDSSRQDSAYTDIELWRVTAPATYVYEVLMRYKTHYPITTAQQDGRDQRTDPFPTRQPHIFSPTCLLAASSNPTNLFLNDIHHLLDVVIILLLRLLQSLLRRPQIPPSSLPNRPHPDHDLFQRLQHGFFRRHFGEDAVITVGSRVGVVDTIIAIFD